MAIGQCPGCDAILSSVTAEAIRVKGARGTSWQGISYFCPSCNRVLSVGIDPLSLKEDTVAAVVDQIRKG